MGGGEGDGAGGPVDDGPGRGLAAELSGRAGLTRGPGAWANSVPMMVPGSVPVAVPIMERGRVPPRIQPGALVPPVIHWYPAVLIIQP